MSTGGPASPQLVTRLVDGLTIQTTDQGGQAIDKLTTQLADAQRKTETAEAALATAIADHAKALEAKDGEITGLKAQVTDEALDKRVSERADLVNTVQSLLGKDYDPTGKSNIAMMTDVASKAYGAEAVKDRSDEYIQALFTTVKKPTGEQQDTVRTTVGDSLRPPAQRQPQRRDVRDNEGGQGPVGRDAYLARLRGGRDHGQRQNGAV